MNIYHKVTEKLLTRSTKRLEERALARVLRLGIMVGPFKPRQ